MCASLQASSCNLATPNSCCMRCTSTPELELHLPGQREANGGGGGDWVDRTARGGPGLTGGALARAGLCPAPPAVPTHRLGSCRAAAPTLQALQRVGRQQRWWREAVLSAANADASTMGSSVGDGAGTTREFGHGPGGSARVQSLQVASSKNPSAAAQTPFGGMLQVLNSGQEHSFPMPRRCWAALRRCLPAACYLGRHARGGPASTAARCRRRLDRRLAVRDQCSTTHTHTPVPRH